MNENACFVKVCNTGQNTRVEIIETGCWVGQKNDPNLTSAAWVKPAPRPSLAPEEQNCSAGLACNGPMHFKLEIFENLKIFRLLLYLDSLTCGPA